MSTRQMPQKTKSTFSARAFISSSLSVSFWILAAAGFAHACYESARPFGTNAWQSWASLMKACDKNPDATLYTIVWGAMVLAAHGAIVRRFVGVKGTWGASVAITLASVISLSERFQAGALTFTDTDRGALLMIAASLAFAGASRIWWLALAPVLAAATIAPLAWLEYWEAMTSGSLLRAVIPVVTSAVVASLVVVVRETRARVLEARAGIDEVTRREEKVANALVKFTSSMARDNRVATTNEIVTAAPLEASLQSAIDSTSMLVSTTVEIEAPSAQTTVGSVTYQELQSLANEALEAVRVKWATRSDVRFLLTAPMDLSLPIAVRGSSDELKLWLRSLVENAADALGGGRGVVRLTLKPTLTLVAIAIEDNGRGLGEDLYSKLGIDDPARIKLDDVKKQAARVGARLDLHSRLGVGTRATLELPRVDALSTLARASRESTAVRTPMVRTNPDSNSQLA